MRLLEVVCSLDSLDDALTVYASEPWTPQSEVLLLREPGDGDLPAEATLRDLVYFLEVFVAKEFVEGWEGTTQTRPSPDEKCRRLIQYARNDA